MCICQLLSGFGLLESKLPSLSPKPSLIKSREYFIVCLVSRFAFRRLCRELWRELANAPISPPLPPVIALGLSDGERAGARVVALELALRWPSREKGMLFAHGFDLGFSSSALREEVLEKLRRQCGELIKEPVSMGYPRGSRASRRL